MTRLCEIAKRNGTDKKPEGHNYTPIYDFYFSKMGKVNKVVEIGVGGGESLRTWKEYFLEAQIWGADISDQNLTNEDRIKSILCDQSKEEDLNRLLEDIGGEVDIFVDDADHQAEHQIYTAKILAPHLRIGGLYIIEDIQNSAKISVYAELMEAMHYKFSISQIETKDPTGDSRLVILERML
jgi:hypothetical protein